MAKTTICRIVSGQKCLHSSRPFWICINSINTWKYKLRKKIHIFGQYEKSLVVNTVTLSRLKWYVQFKILYLSKSQTYTN